MKEASKPRKIAFVGTICGVSPPLPRSWPTCWPPSRRASQTHRSPCPRSTSNVDTGIPGGGFLKLDRPQPRGLKEIISHPIPTVMEGPKALFIFAPRLSNHVAVVSCFVAKGRERVPLLDLD